MPKQPNFLVIMSDQHNRRVMGCAGDPIVRTPNLDRLASQGVRFTNAYCATPVCVPSRMTFMTCKPCADIRVWNNGHMLDSREPTFAHAMSDLGYETVLCGRMHFRGPDQQHGFERRIFGDMYDATWESVGYTPHKLAPTGNMFRDGVFGSVTDDLCRRRPNFFREGKKAKAVNPGPGKSALEAFDEQVTDRAVQFIQQNEHDEDRPLAMVVGLFLPHSPYICNKALFDHYLDHVKTPQVDEQWLASAHPVARKLYERYEGITAQQHHEARAAYFGLVETMDAMVGRILDALSRSPLADNTIVLYISDHGEMAGEHGMWTKSCLLDGATAVPMIWSGPGLPVGTTNENVVSLMDVGATLQHFAGGADSLNAGRSLTGLLAGNDVDWPDEAFTDNHEHRMVRSGRFKLNYYHGYDDIELFDIAADPDENHDLGHDPAYHGVRNELITKVRRDAKSQQFFIDADATPQRNAELYRIAEDYRTPNDLTWVLDQRDNRVEI